MLKLSVALLVIAAGCGKSKCEKYADMEIKCGEIPAKEREITRQLAVGMCEGADSDKSGFAQQFKQEAECAAKHSDCAAYTACTDAIELDVK